MIRGPDDQALVDRLLQADVGPDRRADVAHGGEARLQHVLGVAHGAIAVQKLSVNSRKR